MSETIRDIVEDYWESLPEEQKILWNKPLSDEERAKAIEAQAKLEEILGRPTVTAQEPLVTIFLDGLIKRPASVDDDTPAVLVCEWCGFTIPDPIDLHHDTDIVPDGWVSVARPLSNEHAVMCPACVRTELEE
jgi:hypothetical protein